VRFFYLFLHRYFYYFLVCGRTVIEHFPSLSFFGSNPLLTNHWYAPSQVTAHYKSASVMSCYLGNHAWIYLANSIYFFVAHGSFVYTSLLNSKGLTQHIICSLEQ